MNLVINSFSNNFSPKLSTLVSETNQSSITNSSNNPPDSNITDQWVGRTSFLSSTPTPILIGKSAGKGNIPGFNSALTPKESLFSGNINQSQANDLANVAGKIQTTLDKEQFNPTGFASSDYKLPDLTGNNSSQKNKPEDTSTDKQFFKPYIPQSRMPDNKELSVKRLDKSTRRNPILLKGTDKDDKFYLKQMENGNLLVNINGKKYNYTGEQANRLYFDLGEGNNTLVADESVEYNLIIEAGNGNNKIISGKGVDAIKVGNGNNTIFGGDEKTIFTKAPNGERTKNIKGDYIKVGDGKNTIDAGDGDDKIVAGNGNNRIFGNKGDDNISTGSGNNIIEGNDGDDIIKVGDGKNYIFGGNGNDYIQGGNKEDIISGGQGNDVIYGMGGNDTLFGNEGKDYIYGGSGDDIIDGGSDSDILVGGSGNDEFIKDNYKNVIIDDKLSLKNMNLKDKTYLTGNNNLGKNIQIKGDPDFVARVEADLEVLRAVPSGIHLLRELDKTGKVIKIETTELQNGGADTNDNPFAIIKPGGLPNDGVGSKISYNPTLQSDDGTSEDSVPPVVVLFHELVHAYNNATGTKLRDIFAPVTDQKGNVYYEEASELQAVGLDIKSAIDKNKNLLNFSSIKYPGLQHNSLNNPYNINENGFRRDINLAERTSYKYDSTEK